MRHGHAVAPSLTLTWQEYNENIKRVDAVRVFLMYHFGGVYADLDFLSLRDLKPLLDQNDDVDVILGQSESADLAWD
jgi:mannosyltransferase OCH1-like enzyme